MNSWYPRINQTMTFAIIESPFSSIMYGCLLDHLRSLHHVQERLFNGFKRHGLHTWTRDDNEIQSLWNPIFQTRDCFANKALDPVTNNGVANLFADGNSGTKSSGSLLLGCVQDKLLIGSRTSSLKHVLKLLIFFEPV